MKVFITGDSHTVQLQRATLSLQDTDSWPQEIDLTIKPLGSAQLFSTPFFVDQGEYAEICNENYRKHVKRLPLAGDDGIDVVYGISGPLHTARIMRHPAWGKYGPAEIASVDVPISEGLLRQVIADDCKYIIQLIDILIRSKKPVFVIEPPKPFKRNDRQRRTQMIVRIDGVYRKFVKNELAQRSIPVIELDPEWYDFDGYMLDCYRHENPEDVHHGNEEFGKLMMGKILDFLRDGKL